MLYENQQTKVEDKNNLIDMELMMDMIVKEFNFEVKKVAFTMDISKHCFIIQ